MCGKQLLGPRLFTNSNSYLVAKKIIWHKPRSVAEMRKITRNLPKVVFFTQSESNFLLWALPQQSTGARAASDVSGITHVPEASHGTNAYYTEPGRGWEQADKAEGAAKSTCTSAVTGLNCRRLLRGRTPYSSVCRYITLPLQRAYLVYIYPKESLLGAAPARSVTVNCIARNTAAPTATFLLHYNYFLKMTLGLRYLSGEK